MLLRFFRKTDPFVIFLIVAAVILLWLKPLLNPGIPAASVHDTSPMPLYALLKTITGNSHIAGTAAVMAMLLLMAYLLVSFNTSVIFIEERTFLPAVIYILLVSFFNEYQTLNPVLPASLFLIAALRKIMNTHRVQGIAYDLFDAGFLISAGSLFYANFIVFGILLIAGILLLRSAGIRELLLGLIGMVTPWALITAYYYVSGKETFEALSLLSINMQADMPDHDPKMFETAAIIFMTLVVVISILHLLSVINTRKIRSRKTFFLLLCVLLISVTMFLVSPSVSYEMVWIAGIPESYFLSHYFLFLRRKIVSEIIFTVLFLTVVMMNILN